MSSVGVRPGDVVAAEGARAEVDPADALSIALRALRPVRLEPFWVEFGLPADVTLAYASHPRLLGALAHTRTGRIDAAIAEYSRVAASNPGLAAAHLGLANELTRRRVADRIGRVHAAASRHERTLEPAAPSIFFSDWLRRPDGRWEPLQATASAPSDPGDLRALADAAAEHYRRALRLGAGAAAELGLALLAHEAGRSTEAAARLAAARGADSTLPPLAPN